MDFWHPLEEFYLFLGKLPKYDAQRILQIADFVVGIIILTVACSPGNKLFTKSHIEMVRVEGLAPPLCLGVGQVP